MLNDLTVHPFTHAQLKAIVGKPPQALLLSGEEGVGTKTIAKAMANMMKAENSSVFIIEPDDKGTITIAAVRELYVQTRTKASGKQVIIIDNIDAMGIEAQNAFLKLLEEPNSYIFFILTTHFPNLLLETVKSRAQSITIRPIDTVSSMNFIKLNTKVIASLSAQLLFLGSGRPAELYKLSNDETYRKIALERAAMAKLFIVGSRYQKLTLISLLANLPRRDALTVIKMALHMLRLQLNNSQPDTILQKIRALLLAHDKIAANGHIRTQLLRTIS